MVAPQAKRRRTEEELVGRYAVTVRAVLPAQSAADEALTKWRVRQLRCMDGGVNVDAAEDHPPGGGVAVVVGPIELVAFPMGNYRADVDWLLKDDGLAKLEQSQAASAAIMLLVRCFACLQVSLDEKPEVTEEASAAAVAFLRDELKQQRQRQEQRQEHEGQKESRNQVEKEMPPPSDPACLASGSGAESEANAGASASAAAPRDSCPAGHKLKAHSPSEPVGCDVCEEVVMPGAQTHGCSSCDYDCCHECFALGKAGTTAVVEEEDSANEDGELWKCTDGELRVGADGGAVMSAAAPPVEQSVERLLRDACTAIEEMACAARPLSELHRKIHLSEAQILTVDECDAAVRAADAHAAKNGWATARHAAYATHDLPIDALAKGDARPKAESRVITDAVTTAVKAKLIPEMAARFDLQADALSILDLFIARYSVEPGGLAALEPHEDGSEFSFVLALNSLAEYEGGGTQFLATGVVPHPVFRPDKGYATLFSGKNRHCGLPITSGVRYILAGFLRYRPAAGLQQHVVANGDPT